MSKKPGFMIYHQWEETLLSLTPAELYALMAALFTYSRSGEEPELKKRTVKLLWTELRIQLDRDRERYEALCQQRRQAINKRWNKDEAGGDGMDRFIDW